MPSSDSRFRAARRLPALLVAAAVLGGVLATLLSWLSLLQAFAFVATLCAVIVAGALARRRTESALRAEVDSLRLAEQEARLANRTKSEFLANMSHELRTPLNAVIGSADLLLDASLESDARRHVEVIDASAESLLALIDDILDFAKSEAGQLRLDAVDFRLPDLVQGVRDLLAPTARAKGIALDVEIDPRVPDALHGDPARLRQVLLNLAGNAVKFTAQGEVEIRVDSLEHDGDEGRRLRVVVRDTGIGISPDDQRRIFDSFYQAESLAARRFAGTGLGLSISRSLVARMGGTMGFDSERGVGSTFWFILPMVPPKDEVPATDPAQVVGPDFDRGRFRVLVVDDHPFNRDLALSHLAKLGYRATDAPDGETALARLEAAPIDAVLMDCQMPDLDGYETTRRWRRIERDRSSGEAQIRIPVIAVTAHAMAGERERCLAAGMDDYLAKPYRGADLRRVLDRWLRPGAEPAVDGTGPTPRADAESLAPDAEERIAALRRLGDETGRDLLGAAVAEFAGQGSALRDRMHRALEERDGPTLSDAAHSSIAAAGTLGAARLVELLRTIEAHALDDRFHGVRALIDAAAAESRRVQNLLCTVEDDAHAEDR
ncbi:MAG: ATP-binding protein [Acidobacteriota bacterium]